jgi:hypothetical protein
MNALPRAVNLRAPPGWALAAAVALLSPVEALASFGGSMCKGDFACTWAVIGLIFGAAGGVPVSVVLFAGVHWFFSHPERSKKKQLWVGVALGVLAFEAWAALAAYALMLGEANPGLSRPASLAALACAYAAMLGLSFAYVRSRPR